MQKTRQEQLILLAFTDTTVVTQERKAEKKELEDVISERTTELKQSYKSLKEKNVSLEKMNKELETFTFVSSHDPREEPLRKIRTFAACLPRRRTGKIISDRQGLFTKNGCYS